MFQAVDGASLGGLYEQQRQLIRTVEILTALNIANAFYLSSSTPLDAYN